ncbi:MAG TPA: ATP-binding cassette domain-containing protein [Polyangia bacterium]
MSGLSFAIETQIAVGAPRVTCEFVLGDRPTALVGPNGAGKTSLLLALLGLRPTRGRIVLGDTTLLSTEKGTEERVDLRPELRRLGYVPQSLGLFPHLRVVDNVAFGIASRRDARSRALAWLDQLEVRALADRYPRQLSGGERQRVALARALAAEPRALLLDEPWAALDAPVRRRVREVLLERVRVQKLPTLLVTHDVDDLEHLDGPVIVLEGGQVRQTGERREIAAKPATPFIAQLFADRHGQSRS